MKYIEAQNRTQINLFPITLDDSIDQDNDARLVDLFVNQLNISDLEFKVDHIENGRPAYHTKDLLRIYIYGYMNSIRSWRNLEKECKRNLEMIWLVKGLKSLTFGQDLGFLLLFRQTSVSKNTKIRAFQKEKSI